MPRPLTFCWTKSKIEKITNKLNVSDVLWDQMSRKKGIIHPIIILIFQKVLYRALEVLAVGSLLREGRGRFRRGPIRGPIGSYRGPVGRKTEKLDFLSKFCFLLHMAIQGVLT